ncbi:MAG TPA: peptidylprolyl isomerase [Candidatus Limnocylindria bacterium]
MSFRNRPVLDRKHRPRWQDELRSQQLIVAGFALTIAVAIGIFAAVAWSQFYNDNLRQVALVHGTSVDRSDLERRTDLVAAELTSSYLELESQLGGVRDQIIQQQQQSLQQAISAVEEIAADSLVVGLVMDARSAEFGLSVSDEALEEELDRRRTLPARTQLSIILVEPEVDEDAEDGAEPTEQDREEAKAEIDAVKAELDAGGDWAALAAEHSDHSTAQTEGLLGWVTQDDPAFGEFHADVADAEAGTVVGPLENEDGWYLLRVEERLDERPNERLADFLEAAGISDAAYRDYVRQDLMQGEFRDYFTDTVVGRYAPQQHVAQILIAADTDVAAPDPKIHIRHLLAKPLPDEQDQSGATDEDWEDALERAEELRERALEPNADWYALADESDDAGTRTRGGSLGWHDPATLDTQFVATFAEAAAALDVGEISEPVRSEFGYHIIQVTDRRVNALELANRLSAQLEDDPDAFERLARDYSEDPVSAEQGGDLGWVVPYQLENERQDVIFALSEPGEVSEPLVTADGIYIFRLIDSAELRYVPGEKREQVAGSGFSRWLVELEDDAGVWVDPELAPATTTTGGDQTVPF